MDDSKIIDALGGTGKVAALCEVKPPSVSEWRTKGIPKAQRRYLKLLHPEAFEVCTDVESGPEPATDSARAA